MMIRLVALLGCLVGVSARSFEYDFSRDKPAFSWWSENRQANLMRLDYAANPLTGKLSLHAGWDEAFTTYMHVYSGTVPALPAVPVWRFRIKLTTAGPVGVRQCSLRLQDQNHETFCFDRAVRWDRAGEWTLDFVVDSAAPAFTRTAMHGKDANKQLDLPLSTFGISFTFAPGSGEGEVFLDAIVCEAVTPDPADAGRQTVTAGLAESFLQANRRPLLLPLGNGTQVALVVEGIQITPETGSRSAGVRFCLAGWSPNGVLAPQFPAYEKAELTATVSAPDCDIDEVALRVVDLDGNNHRLPFAVKWQATESGGQHRTTMELPTALPSPKPGDNRQFPLFCLQGLEFHSPKGMAGTIQLENLSLRATMPVVNALALELETDSEPKILRPDGNGQVKAILRNTLSVPVAVEANLRLTDYNDEPEADGWSLRQTLSFQPGEAKTFLLPRPKRLGVCYVNVDLSLPGEATVARCLQQTFAYLIPTGTQRPLAPQDFLFGSVAHLNPYFGARPELERVADAMATIGLRIVRTDMRNSRDDYLEWYDQVVDIFRARGIEFDLILGYVFDRQGKVDYAASNERYGEWFRRYRGKVRFWEMLNEPDGAWGRKNPPMADDYVRLARQTRELLTECDPAAGYMSAGFCRFDEPILGHFHADTMRQIPNLFDLHCFHGHGPFPHFAHAMIDGKLLPMRQELGIRIPWYANETALTSCGGTSEKEQAQAVFTKSLFSWARGSVGYTWYNLREKGKSPTNGEHNYGMLSFDLYPKPVYAAYNALTALYSGKRFVQQLPLPSPFWGFVFRDDTETVLALWSEDARCTSLAFRTDARAAEAVDVLGNPEPLEMTDGLVMLAVGPDPRTLRLPGATTVSRLPDPVQVTPPPLLLPGKACTLAVRAANPLPTPQRATIVLKTPEYIAAGNARAEKLLAPNEQWSWETTLTLSPDHRADYGAGEPMVVETSLGAFPLLRTREDVPVALAFAPGLDGQPLFVLDRRDQVVSLTVGDPLKEHRDWQGPDDLSARAWVDLTADALVLKVDVTDDTHCQPYSTPADCWQGDGLQVFVTRDTMTTPCEFDFYLGDDGQPHVLCRRAAPDAGIRDLPAAEKLLRLVASRDGTATHYLVAIPYAALAAGRGDLKRGFRLNFMVNENDGEGRDGWIRPAPGVGNGVDCRQHPLLLPSE